MVYSGWGCDITGTPALLPNSWSQVQAPPPVPPLQQGCSHSQGSTYSDPSYFWAWLSERHC